MNTQREIQITMMTSSVQAILAGMKTQTRRPVQPQPHVTIDTRDVYPHEAIDARDGRTRQLWYAAGYWPGQSGDIGECPYGVVGDLLWVRETWLSRGDGAAFIYRADHSAVDAAGLAGMYSVRGWRPPWFMPKHAARLWLRVTGVRVQRLQAITADDAMREGYEHIVAIPESAFSAGRPEPIPWYREGWDKMWAKKWIGWESNPFVWVIDFRHAERPAG